MKEHINKEILKGWLFWSGIIYICIVAFIGFRAIIQRDTLRKENTELLKVNQHLKSENTFLQKERAWNKSDKRLLK